VVESSGYGCGGWGLGYRNEVVRVIEEAELVGFLFRVWVFGVRCGLGGGWRGWVWG